MLAAGATAAGRLVFITSLQTSTAEYRPNKVWFLHSSTSHSVLRQFLIILRFLIAVLTSFSEMDTSIAAGFALCVVVIVVLLFIDFGRIALPPEEFPPQSRVISLFLRRIAQIPPDFQPLAAS